MFELVRALAEAALAKSSHAVANSDVLKAVQCWLVWAVRADAKVALQQGAENEAQEMQKVVDVLHWTKTAVVPAMRSPEDALAMSLLALVLAQSSDLFYLDLAAESVHLALAECIDALPAQSGAEPAVAQALRRLDAILLADVKPADAPVVALKASVKKAIENGQSGATSSKDAPVAVLETGAVEAQVWAST